MKTRITLLTSILAILFAAAGLAQTRYNVTIPAGQSVSSAVTLPNGCQSVAIALPGALAVAGSWTPADITVQVSVAAPGGVEIWGNVRDDYGMEKNIRVVAASDIVQLTFVDWFWMKRTRVRSGIATMPVVQAADRTLSFICAK